MKSSKINIVFIIVILIALFLFSYLMYNILSQINDARQLIKIFSTLLIPVPISIFIGYVFAAKSIHIKEYTRKDIVISVILFVLMMAVIILSLSLFNIDIQPKKYNSVIFPVFLNSTITLIFIINHITIKNIKLSGALSGILLGLAIYVFMLN